MTKYTAVKQHAPTDESVQLPAAIRAAAARSAALHKDVYEEPTPETPPVTEPPVAQEPPAATPPAAEPAPETPPDWEANYKAMKGRFDKATDTISGLNSRISQLENLLSRAAAQPTQPIQTPTPDMRFKPVTQEDKENYGEEFLDVAARAAAEKLVPELASLRAEVSQLRSVSAHSAEEQERRAKEKMYSDLDAGYTDWRKTNRDPNFNAWLNLPDPFSGVIRRNMMLDAFEKADGQRVLRFFQGFLSDEAATGPATTQTELPNGKVPLETFAAPGRAKAPAASVATAPVEKETITHAQIAAFYSDVQRGRYKGNEAEKDRLEAMIFEAQAEGRVV